jgi:hypothetical protein
MKPGPTCSTVLSGAIVQGPRSARARTSRRSMRCAVLVWLPDPRPQRRVVQDSRAKRGREWRHTCVNTEVQQFGPLAPRARRGEISVRAPRAAERKSARACCQVAVREQGEIEKHYSVYFSIDCGDWRLWRAPQCARRWFVRRIGIVSIRGGSRLHQRTRNLARRLGRARDIGQGGHR